jgi:hypothetical protein
VRSPKLIGFNYREYPEAYRAHGLRGASWGVAEQIPASRHRDDKESMMMQRRHPAVRPQIPILAFILPGLDDLPVRRVGELRVPPGPARLCPKPMSEGLSTLCFNRRLRFTCRISSCLLTFASKPHQTNCGFSMRPLTCRTDDFKIETDIKTASDVGPKHPV